MAIITDGNVSLEFQFLHGKLCEKLLQVTGGCLVVLFDKLIDQFRIFIGERKAIDDLRSLDDTFEDELGLVVLRQTDGKRQDEFGTG